MAYAEPALQASFSEAHPAVTILRSTWSRARLCKTIRRGGDGSIDVVAYRAGIFFVPESIPVAGIRDRYRVISRVAADGNAMEVRGGLSGEIVPMGTPVRTGSGYALSRDHVTRRTQRHPDGHAPGLVDTARPWLSLDADGIPNPLGLDPRTQPDAVMHFVVGLLPPEIGTTTLSWRWSSSACVGLPAGQSPPTLRLHLELWLDVPLGGSDARMLMERLEEYVWHRLEALNVRRTGKAIIDRKVAEPQQPLYVAAPRFEGVADPFPGSLRRGLREGVRDAVRLSTLEAELDATGIPRLSQAAAAKTGCGRGKATSAAPRRSASRQRPLPSLPPLPVGDAMVVPMAAARRLRDAEEASRKAHRTKHARTWREVDRRLFAARTPLEIVRLCRGRAELGATDPRWAAWHAAGGVPEGSRDAVLFMIGCLVAESLPAAALTDEYVNAEIVSIGRLAMDAGWIGREWLGERFYGAVVGRAVAAGLGMTEVWQGVAKDPRYRVGKARLLRALAVDVREVARYGLMSLASDRDRLAAQRRARGGPCPAPRPRPPMRPRSDGHGG